MDAIHSGTEAFLIEEAAWRKSRRSNPSGACVELAELADGTVAVRDSKNPAGPVLVYGRTELGVLISALRGG